MSHNPGLNSSFYASQAGRDERYSSKPGNWTCPTCRSLVSLRHPRCPQCSADTLKEGAPNSNANRLGTTQPRPDPSFSGQKAYNENARPSISVSRKHTENVPASYRGLSTSYWARTPSGSHHLLKAEEVWTRTTAVKPLSIHSKSTPATPPDLGLPYEVQHYILTLMQRMVEEGCWIFALRWIPQKLYEKGWTCAEQVELSTWRDELPGLLPQGAITPLPNYTLSTALRDAVGIRNAATHRHLCDNAELKRMAQKAECLMALFDDVTRRNKFQLLEVAIQEWDTEFSEPYVKREKLEHALQEISERPLNDMDWSPNSSTLQEITSVDESPAIAEVEDLMDMD